jgi:hypothetical protein
MPRTSGFFRANHDEADVLAEDEAAQGRKIQGRKANIGAAQGGAGIAGGDKEPCAKGALCQFPCDGVFAATATQQENIHGLLIRFRRVIGVTRWALSR